MEYILRQWSPSDEESVLRYADNPKIAANLRDAFPQPYVRINARAFIQSCLASDPAKDLFLAINVDGQAVGSIGVFKKDDVYQKSAELGYWLAEPYWGRGIMSAAAREMCRIAFERLDIVRIFAEPFAHNAGSRRVLEKAGFTLEGVLRRSVIKNGVIGDSCIYALLRNELRENN